MVLVVKLSSFAFAVYDGARFAHKNKDAAAPWKPFAPSQARLAVGRGDGATPPPGALAFLGYAFFFGSVMAGPAFDYAAYARFTAARGFAGARPSLGEGHVV